MIINQMRSASQTTQGPKGKKWQRAQVPTVKIPFIAVFVAKVSMRSES
jgi:hypothetical protein